MVLCTGYKVLLGARLLHSSPDTIRPNRVTVGKCVNPSPFQFCHLYFLSFKSRLLSTESGT